MKNYFRNNITKILFAVILTLIFLTSKGTTDFFSAFSDEKKPCLCFYALKVGQGDSSLFILPDGSTVLIDAGTEDSARDVVRYLKEYGVKKIDLLIATHPHSDHIGGMKAVMAAFPIGKVWDSGFIHGSLLQKNFYMTIKKKNIPFGRPKKGFTEKLGGAVVEVLAPSKLLRGTKRDANNNCLVIRIKYGNVSFLMAADMEREQRSTVGPIPQSTVLKAAHHGSRNGTDLRMLKEVKPYLIILSYGRSNLYGYPHKEVTKAILQTHTKRFDTKDGNIKIQTDGEKLIYPENREVR